MANHHAIAPSTRVQTNPWPTLPVLQASVLTHLRLPVEAMAVPQAETAEIAENGDAGVLPISLPTFIIAYLKYRQAQAKLGITDIPECETETSL